MKGVILAAGKGSRLSELNLQHKSFAVVHKKRVINFSLDLLTNGGADKSLVDEVVIVVGHNKEVIIEAIGDSYCGVPVKYVEQKELKGIAHAVLTAKDVINDDFIMCLADEILINPNMAGMVKRFYEDKASCVCGVIIDGADQSGKPIAYKVNGDTIIEVEEKPANGYPNDIRGIGEVVFAKKCLDYLMNLEPNPRRGELEMGDWIQTIATANGDAKVFELADAYVNINYASDIDAANKILQNHK